MVLKIFLSFLLCAHVSNVVCQTDGCADSTNWASLYGDCATYTEGNDNHIYCEEDPGTGINSAQFAIDACPKACNFCPDLTSLVGFVTHGHEVNPAFKYRWMGWIHRYGSSNTVCGGTLVASAFVLTAAHCKGNFLDDQYEIDFLRHDVTDGNEREDAIVRRIVKIYTHPEYNLDTNEYDVALWELNEPIPSNLIDPIQLDLEGVFGVGTSAAALGWGITETGQYSDVLRIVEIPVIECPRSYAWFPSQLCALGLSSGQSLGVCIGDSGGPLFSIVDEIQIGIVSFGDSECTDPSIPDTFVRIGHPIVAKFVVDILANDCDDTPHGWIDAIGNGCEAYAAKTDLCDVSYILVDGYDVDASRACCACGGGTSLGCEDLPDWQDSEGATCDVYERFASDECHESFNYRNENDLDARDACCICGGGQLEDSETPNSNEQETELLPTTEIDDDTQHPTSLPTDVSTYVPTLVPTIVQTLAPTHVPPQVHTNVPTDVPTNAPTHEPTDAPTHAPTHVLSNDPTNSQTNMPTHVPTETDGDCIKPCPRNYDPLCGKNGITYTNKCELDVMACLNESDIEVDCQSECPCAATDSNSVVIDIDSEFMIANPLPSNQFFGTGFGKSVTVLGDTFAVGVPLQDSDGISWSGAVYMYRRDESSDNEWTLLQELRPSPLISVAFFGYSVLMAKEYRNLVFIGASDEDAGDYSPVGAVYIFQRDTLSSGGLYSQAVRLAADDLSSGFGNALSLHQRTLAIGAHYTPTDYLLDGRSSEGAVYIFELEIGSNAIDWTQTHKIVADDPNSYRFGTSVCMTSKLLAVGSQDDSVENSNAGAVYLFEKTVTTSGTEWTKTTKLAPEESAPFAMFGNSISISENGRSIAIGARQSHDTPEDAGIVYIYTKRPTGEWALFQQIYLSDAGTNEYFGWDVQFSGRNSDHLIVSALSASGVSEDTGAVYVFLKESEWVEIGKVFASNGGAGDNFGTAVGLDDSVMVVGAEDAFAGEGAVYVYTI